MYLPNLKSVVSPVPEIIGVSKKFGSPWIRPRSLSPKFLMAFCSNGACECECISLTNQASSLPKVETRRIY